MKKILNLIILLPIFAIAQKQPKAVKVTYQKSYLGTVQDVDNPIIIYSDAKQTLVTSKKAGVRPMASPT
ncbi:MAG: hypothetical protein V4581_01435, partial [Bacteroidota bacterium]